MHQYILQDMHQIRSIAQQPTQTKRQNTQQFSQHLVSKNVTKNEIFVAQQLQNVIGLTDSD